MTNESHIELDEMQQQFQLLREKLDQQEIVSDKLVSEIVRQKISSLNRDARIIGLVALLGIPYTLFISNVPQFARWQLARVILQLHHVLLAGYIRRSVSAPLFNA